jgi:plasmid stabilization system protein ParE
MRSRRGRRSAPVPRRPSPQERLIPIVELSRRAAAEIERARTWWLETRDKAPSAFDEELAKLVDLLEHAPTDAGQHARNMPGRRRVFLERIRHYVYCRIIDDGERVQMLACWHASRGQEPRL